MRVMVPPLSRLTLMRRSGIANLESPLAGEHDIIIGDDSEAVAYDLAHVPGTFVLRKAGVSTLTRVTKKALVALILLPPAKMIVAPCRRRRSRPASSSVLDGRSRRPLMVEIRHLDANAGHRSPDDRRRASSCRGCAPFPFGPIYTSCSPGIGLESIKPDHPGPLQTREASISLPRQHGERLREKNAGRTPRIRIRERRASDPCTTPKLIMLMGNLR